MTPLRLLLLAVASTLLSAQALAADPKAPARAGPPTPSVDASKMPPELKAWVAAGTPGEFHAALARLAGSYTVESTFWAGPGDATLTSKASCDFTLILGGRVLKQDFKGSMMGQPFEGLGLFGYDTVKKRFVSAWMDSMSTQRLDFEGLCKDKGCTVIELKADYKDPLTGKRRRSRSLYLEREGKPVMQMFDTDKRGREFKSLELVYTRR